MLKSFERILLSSLRFADFKMPSQLQFQLTLLEHCAQRTLRSCHHLPLAKAATQLLRERGFNARNV